MAVYKVLEQFKEHQAQLAIVVDEYGIFQGVLSSADVFDALIGDINLGITQESEIIIRDENSWLVDGQYPYYELVNYFEINNAQEPEGFTTIGGLILHLLHRFPSTGDKVSWEGFEIEIIDMDVQRIDKVLITRK